MKNRTIDGCDIIVTFGGKILLSTIHKSCPTSVFCPSFGNNNNVIKHNIIYLRTEDLKKVFSDSSKYSIMDNYRDIMGLDRLPKKNICVYVIKEPE